MENKNPRHLFHKLFLSYSAVLILIVGVLILYFISSSRTRMLETNQDYAGKLCGEAVLEVNRASSDADYLHRAIYQNNSELQDMLNYFRYETEEYLKRHLDTYASSNTVDNKDIYSYVENAYSAYPDIKKIELISYTNNKTTVFYSENDIRVDHNGRERRKEILDGGLASPGSYSFQKEIRDPLSMRIEGCIVFTFDTGTITAIQEKYPMAGLYLYYNNGNQVYPEKDSLLLKDLQQEDAGRKLRSYIQIQSVEDYIVATRLDKHTAASIPVVHILAILAIGAVLVIAGEILISSYLKRLTKRLDGIIQGMDQVQTGNLKVQLPENENGDELDMISRHFNLMCQELESYIQKSYLAEIEQQNAEMQALQSQINPHFLYNTLEAIRMKAICNGDREVGKMLYSLAVTFRSQLKEADVITLMQEMHYCKKYLELFEYRYQGKFRSSVECSPELSKIPVIKFILQPIIENYFIHGIRMEESDNEIGIYARRIGEDLYIHVEDNGRGMPGEDMENKNRELKNNEMDTRKSIGMTNVNRRLKAAYGDTCGVFLKANRPRGMHVILLVKVKERETDEKVMLVEDEELILQGIRNIIDWEALGLDVVHMAHNGKEALSLWEKEPVDLVVTDVEMPVMNGLNLLKEIRSRNERVRFVILTGYDEFEYARKAIQLDVEDYILKPIDEEQLEAVAKKALLKLQEMDQDNARKMEDRIGWQKFLEGGSGEEERKTFLSLLPKVKKAELLSAAVMKIDSRSMRKGDMSELLSILQEEACRVIHLKADTLLLIECFSTDYTWNGGEGETARKIRSEIHSRFSYLQNRLESELGIFTFIGIGPSFTDYETLPEVYREAMRMQKYRMLDGYGSCVDENHIKNRGSKDVAIDETQLRKMILQKDRDGAINYIEDLFINNIRKDADVNNLYQTALKIAMLLWDIKGEYKLEEKNMQDLSDMVEGIYGAEDIFGLKAMFISEISEIITYLHTENSAYTPVVKQIMTEVQKNYKEELSLKTLAYKYHMNASYLGQIFQKEVGCSFTQYLSNIKNGIAKDPILNTNRRINDIAQEVGYTDTSYFYRKFKQCYGVSPASLREMKKY